MRGDSSKDLEKIYEAHWDSVIQTVKAVQNRGKGL